VKAMILAAGLGQRMLPLTENTPKPLLLAGGRMLIEWQILRLQEAGISEIVINHHHLGQQIENALGDGQRYGVRLHYSAEPERLETAGGIIRALPLLGKEPFVLTNADIWTDYDFSRLTRRTAPAGSAALMHMVMVPNPAHNTAGDFSLDNGWVGEQQAPRYTYAGISMLHPDFFAGESERFLPLLPLLRKAIAERRVSGEFHTGQWHDIGTPERLQWLDRYLGAR
jgi:MurNAc alpha-1-phosphate uridylyltransferase